MTIAGINNHGNEFLNYYFCYGDDFAKNYFKNSDVVIEVLTKYGDDGATGLKAHNDTFVELYVTHRDKFVEDYLKYQDEAVEAYTKHGDEASDILNGNGTGVTEGGSNTGTIWNRITSTADNIPGTEIPTTFQIDMDENINYINPTTGTNTLWTNTNATKHMGEYISRFGEESWSIGVRSQAMLESYSASLNEAMKELMTKDAGRYFGTYGNWELGINTETGTVFHALMVD